MESEKKVARLEGRGCETAAREGEENRVVYDVEGPSPPPPTLSQSRRGHKVNIRHIKGPSPPAVRIAARPALFHSRRTSASSFFILGLFSFSFSLLLAPLRPLFRPRAVASYIRSVGPSVRVTCGLVDRAVGLTASIRFDSFCPAVTFSCPLECTDRANLITRLAIKRLRFPVPTGSHSSFTLLLFNVERHTNEFFKYASLVRATFIAQFIFLKIFQ